jgi:hypothetical protein
VTKCGSKNPHSDDCRAEAQQWPIVWPTKILAAIEDTFTVQQTGEKLRTGLTLSQF